MSKDLPPFGEAEWVFMHPHMVFSDRESGKPLLELKRKQPSQHDIYYIFKLTPENASDDKAMKHIETLFEKAIIPFAKALGIPFYNSDDLSKAMYEAVEKIGIDNIPEDEQIDTEIKVKDHATGEVRELVIGISGGLKSDDEKPS